MPRKKKVLVCVEEAEEALLKKYGPALARVAEMKSYERNPPKFGHFTIPPGYRVTFPSMLPVVEPETTYEESYDE